MTKEQRLLDVEDVDALKPQLQDLATRVGTDDRKLLATTVAALDQHIGLVAGGQFEPSAHLSVIQRVLVAAEHGRGTPGEQALAAIALCRRDLNSLVLQAKQAEVQAEQAFAREEQAVRDATAKVTQLKAEHAAEIQTLTGRLAAHVAASKASHEAAMNEIKKASANTASIWAAAGAATADAWKAVLG